MVLKLYMVSEVKERRILFLKDLLQKLFIDY